ncbi:MAG: amidophosphoribosyltransferase [Flavobacteriales bacterium]|mgnify:FL=1|nr:amidophosphoribosyltransferase [Flavobacteriales bacterium]|tara:strand:- start:1373 stop:3262 length:1890 start_codon:yes stop_codon:yes gene_type:complete
MSDSIKHECGIALLRLLKPLSYYKKKYGTALYGLNKMYLLMQKQVNRGQDGAGLVNIKIDTDPGRPYISRRRSVEQNSIQDVFLKISENFKKIKKSYPKEFNNAQWLKENCSFMGELFLGHLRYGTYGGNSISQCHPFLRQNNWKSRNLVLAGNFNMTNVEELFNQLVDLGQHPKEKSDTITILEKIGHFTDEENTRLYNKYKPTTPSNSDISKLIEENLDLANILKNASKKWDGGYVLSGLIGHGDAFALRDPHGIRPAYYYYDQEIVVVASEKPVIQTAFNVNSNNIYELPRGEAIIIKKNGKVSFNQIIAPKKRTSCSFERIYFSRGNDASIYEERKKLGALLTEPILKKINNDLDNTLFSYIPNTAETAFLGLISELESNLNTKRKNLLELGEIEHLKSIINQKIRVEKMAVKDAKLRTFITADSDRDGLVGHIYDVTYGVSKKTDTLVILDDSIVRGTTLKKSILRILDRLKLKKIIVVSSAPQIRYPDCYGIDMARLGDFIAFRAAISLLKKTNDGKEIIKNTYKECKKEQVNNNQNQINHLKNIYAPFTQEEISKEIALLLKTDNISTDFDILFQTKEGLRFACPNHTGDWYFTGDYPTSGGNMVANRSFIYYVEGNESRAY